MESVDDKRMAPDSNLYANKSFTTTFNLLTNGTALCNHPSFNDKREEITQKHDDSDEDDDDNDEDDDPSFEEADVWTMRWQLGGWCVVPLTLNV